CHGHDAIHTMPRAGFTCSEQFSWLRVGANQEAAWAYQRPTIANQIEDLQTSVLAAAVATSVTARSSGVTQ
ncbi:hypothetical protein, partial [Xanthomonas cassavae]|uniref:hypothetical protein n=1 Tax=Xanthomonas cassavae TaxID=56450 RepID=UPI001F3781B8